MQVLKQKLKVFLFIGIVSCLLTACASSTIKPMPSVKLYPPSDLMTPCESLPVLQEHTMGDLVIYSSDLMTAYGYCGLKLQALQKWVAINN